MTTDTATTTTTTTTTEDNSYNTVDCLFPHGFIYTHMNVDLDAVCSLWFARHVLGHQGEFKFVPANWDGEGFKEGKDIALDLNVRGKGIKGEKEADGTTHSCLAYLVNKYRVGGAPNPAESWLPGPWMVCTALESLEAFVDAQDAHGSAVKYLAPEATPEAQRVLGATGLNAVLRAIQASTGGNDRGTVEQMTIILDGMLRAGVNRLKAEEEADRAELIGDGKVAICDNNHQFATNGVLFERGVRAVVFVDGTNLGVCRSSEEKTRMDSPAALEVIKDAGEEVGEGEGKWFAHPAGFLLARGTRKAPSQSLSKVFPMALAEAVLSALPSRWVLIDKEGTQVGVIPLYGPEGVRRTEGDVLRLWDETYGAWSCTLSAHLE